MYSSSRNAVASSNDSFEATQRRISSSYTPSGELPVARPSTAPGLVEINRSMMSAPKTATASASGWITTSIVSSALRAAMLRIEHHASVDDGGDDTGYFVEQHQVRGEARSDATELGALGEACRRGRRCRRRLLERTPGEGHDVAHGFVQSQHAPGDHSLRRTNSRLVDYDLGVADR